MTFYWWSHWFWITLLNTLLFSTIVHTYPSQEFKDDKYNENSKPVTKLFQTGTTLIWATTAPTLSTQIMDLTQAAGTSRESVEASNESETPAANIEYEEVEALEIESGKNELEKPKDDATYMDENSDEYEFKRSAEVDSNRTDKLNAAALNLETLKQKTNSNDTHEKSSAIKTQTNKKPTITIAEDDSLAAASAAVTSKISNDNADNNFSINFTNISTNATTNFTNNSNNATVSTSSTTPTTTNSSAPPSAPAAPQIDSEAAAAEWLHTAVVPPAAVAEPNIADISSNLVTAASASQKVPFTLENANKEAELRRAESEHRSRKSKVLSGDYKQINHYINYSADPKSLLARSASTAPNEFSGDNESNISSEALAIQRTYFLDAGAISAICFTVFGVCCTVGTIGIVLYRRRYLNKPQTLSEPDSSVYIDDSTMRVSDNSDEMYSLDNDSFLNSLEAMTIQNYWTDTVKHTKL